MYFTRYEIRFEYWEDGDMEYIPFDTLSQAEEYIRTHKDTCKSAENVKCTLYKIKLYSTYETKEIIKTL